VDLSERGAAEARHPWEAARADFLIELLRTHGLLLPPRRWLDVGAGDGWLAFELAEAAGPGHELLCWDINYDQATLGDLTSRLRGVDFTAAEPAGRFDVLLLLDVLEHVEDDTGFLRGLVRDHLAPDGYVLVTVPAWQSLFSAHDAALRHYRRYSPRDARRLLAESELTPRVQGGLFHSLLLPRIAQIVGERLGRRPDQSGVGSWSAGPTVTRAVTRILSAETRLSARLGRLDILAPGLSYWALCEVTR
jgi:SAM-dependent methyltransferase